MKSKRILARLEDLRRALVSADGEADGAFARVFHTFFDIADDPALISASKPTKNGELRLALDRALFHLTDDEEKTIQQVKMLRVADVGMIHGAFFAPGWHGSFFYFEREKRGLAAFLDGGPLTHFMRVTLTEGPPGTFPGDIPQGVQ